MHNLESVGSWVIIVLKELVAVAPVVGGGMGDTFQDIEHTPLLHSINASRLDSTNSDNCNESYYNHCSSSRYSEGIDEADNNDGLLFSYSHKKLAVALGCSLLIMASVLYSAANSSHSARASKIDLYSVRVPSVQTTILFYPPLGLHYFFSLNARTHRHCSLPEFLILHFYVLSGPGGSGGG